MFRQTSPDRTSLLRSQIERQVLFLRVEETKLLALVGVDDGEDAGDGFAEVVAGGGEELVLDFPAFSFSDGKERQIRTFL